jgi:hypothetical protein
MFFNAIQKTLFLSISILTISSSIFSAQALALSQVYDPTKSDPSVVSPPAINQDSKINLKVASTVMENGKWTGKFNYSNNNQWENDVKCNTLVSRFNGMTGIADYRDGISLEKFKTYPNLNEIRTNYSKYFAGCEYLNQKTYNINGCNFALLSPETYEESQKLKPAVCNIPLKASLPGQSTETKNTPIFAYQYRYEIKFDAQNKTKMSNDYRPMTAIDGDYDGVVFTYTYYTYQQNNQWKEWENPNKDNKWGGWLIYGSQLSQEKCLSLNGCNLP